MLFAYRCYAERTVLVAHCVVLPLPDPVSPVVAFHSSCCYLRRLSVDVAAPREKFKLAPSAQGAKSTARHTDAACAWRPILLPLYCQTERLWARLRPLCYRPLHHGVRRCGFIGTSGFRKRQANQQSTEQQNHQHSDQIRRLLEDHRQWPFEEAEGRDHQAH